MPRNNPPYPSLEYVLNTIADWISRYRRARNARAEIDQCDSREVAKMAADLGISSAELTRLATKDANSTALLEKLLVALGVEAQASHDTAVMRDLQRLCVFCGHKERCAHELDNGSAAEHFKQYCPNAYTLDALLTEKGIRRAERRHR